MTTNGTPTVNKDELYGHFLGPIKAKQRLGMRAAHMALDIPEADDVNIDNRKSGLGWREMAVIGASAVALAALGAYAFKPLPQPGTNVHLEQPAAPAPTPAPVTPRKPQNFGVRID